MPWECMSCLPCYALNFSTEIAEIQHILLKQARAAGMSSLKISEKITQVI